MKPDNALTPVLMGVGIALLMLTLWQREQSYSQTVEALQQQLRDTQIQFQSYREGVMSHD
jgi:uncharacterized membrane-anchored protein YhcB (DUF1043 family)